MESTKNGERQEWRAPRDGEHQEWRAPRYGEHQEWKSKDLIRLFSSFLFLKFIEPPRSLFYSKWPREEAKGERAKRFKVGMERVGRRNNLPPSPSIALAIFKR